MSKGELAKTGLLVALAHRPELLILDEPTSGLDPLVRPYLESGRLVRLWQDDVTLSRSFHLVRRTDRIESNRFDLFRSWLMGEAAAAA